MEWTQMMKALTDDQMDRQMDGNKLKSLEGVT